MLAHFGIPGRPAACGYVIPNDAKFGDPYGRCRECERIVSEVRATATTVTYSDAAVAHLLGIVP